MWVCTTVIVLSPAYVIENSLPDSSYDPKCESYGDYLFAPSVSCFNIKFVPSYRMMYTVTTYHTILAGHGTPQQNLTPILY